MQCASSTATKLMRTDCRNCTFSAFVRLSGATYSNFVRPEMTSSFTCNVSALFKLELRKCATAASSWWARRASTWFFIKAMSGDTTMAVPSSIRAGNW